MFDPGFHGIMVRVRMVDWIAGYTCSIFQLDGKGRTFAASDLDLQEIAEGAVLPQTMVLQPDACQLLMDDLWMCGIRPTEGAGTAGSMRATERHLTDMRALVEKFAKAKLGKL